jgi:hypothetical protein
MSYGGSGRTVSVPASLVVSQPGVVSRSPDRDTQPTAGLPKRVESREMRVERVKKSNASNGDAPASASRPDFAKMTPAERLAYHRARLDRMFGE